MWLIIMLSRLPNPPLLGDYRIQENDTYELRNVKSGFSIPDGLLFILRLKYDIFVTLSAKISLILS